jgi:hypothetical protein
MQQFVVMSRCSPRCAFGQWDAIPRAGAAPRGLPYPTAIWHFAAGHGHWCARRAGPPLRTSLQALQDCGQGTDGEAQARQQCGRRLLPVAEALLRGELALRRGDTSRLDRAARGRGRGGSASSYNEPADWPLPVRPYLGAALLQAGRAREAGAGPTAAGPSRPIRTTAWSLVRTRAGQRASRRHRGRRRQQSAAFAPPGSGRTRHSRPRASRPRVAPRGERMTRRP